MLLLTEVVSLPTYDVILWEVDQLEGQPVEVGI
jgi:hypothetical protein